MVRKETGVPEEWMHWYREAKGKFTPEELERARKIDRELNAMYPPASAEHRRVFDEAEKLVQDANKRLRASGSWSLWSDGVIKEGKTR